MADWLTQYTAGANALAAPPTTPSIDDQLAKQRAILSGTTSSVSSLAPRWLGNVPPKTTEEKPRSLLGQIGHLVAGIPQGVAGLLGEAVETAVAVPRFGYDALTGDLHRDERFSGFQSYLAHYAPAVNTLGTSFVHTGERLTHPGEYLDAIREGRIVDALAEDIGNVAIFGGAASKVLGAAGKTVEVASLADARAIAQPGLRSVGAAINLVEDAGPRVVAPAGSKIPSIAKMLEFAPEEGRYVVQLPGKGLAGMAEKAGMSDLAQTLTKSGDVVRTITKLGERGAALPAAPYEYGYKALSKGLEMVGVPKLSTLANRAIEASAKRGGILFGYSEIGRRFGAITADVDRASTDAAAFAMEAAKGARDEGLSLQEGSAVLFALDRPLFLDSLRSLPEEEARRVVNDVWRDVPSAYRPTYDDIRTAWDYQDRNLPAERLQKMDLVRDRVERIAVQRKNMLGVAGEHLAPELRPSIIRGLQMKIERRRESLLKRRGTEWIQQRRADHLANAYDILVDQLPRVIDEEHLRTLQALEAKTQEYAALSDGAPAPAFRTVEQELERLTTELHELGQKEPRLRARSVEAMTQEGSVEAAIGPERTGAQPALPSRAGIDQLAEGVDRTLTREEQLMRRAGAARAEANRRSGRIARIDSAVSRADERIASMATEMGRSFQQRLMEDVNTPMLNRWRSMIHRRGAALGDLVGKGRSRHVTGLVGELARRYDVERQLLERIGPGKPKITLADEFSGIDYGGLTATEKGRLLVDVLTENGKTLDNLDATKLRDAVGAAQLLEDIDVMVHGASEEGLALNVPFRVRELIESSDWPMPDDLRSELTKAFDDYGAKRSRHLTRTFDDYARVIPARYRTLHQDARRQIRALLDEGERMNKAVAGSGDHMVRLAEETASTMAEYVDAGLDPVHLIGGKEAPTSGLSAGRGGLAIKAQRAEKLRRTGLRPVNLEAYARLEAQEAATFINNRRNEYILDAFGKRADDIPQVRDAMLQWSADHYGEPMPAADIVKAAKDAGYSLPESRMALGEPPPRPGMVRVYRAETVAPRPLQAVPDSGVLSPARADIEASRWFTTDKAAAAAGGDPISYVDLTDAEFASLGETKTSGGRVEGADVQLPRPWAERASPLPNRMKAAEIDGSTLFVEHAIKKAMDNTKVDSVFFNMLRKGNRMWKSWVLPISPKWLMGNVIGNVFMAGIHAGVGPFELARRMREIKNLAGGWRELWDRSGLREGAPRRLSAHGLTQTEWALIRDHMESAPRTKFGAKVAGGLGWSWKMNEFVDNLTRDAVYLQQLKNGVPSEAAIANVLSSLGDFTRLSPIERRVVRELLPFYTWIRHSTGAMLRLPINSPTRAAFLLNLSQLYSEPDMANELLQAIGGKFMLGGDTYFDLGGVSPFPTEFNPFKIAGQATSPLIKLPVALGTGFNLGTFKTYNRPPQYAKTGAFGEEAQPPLWRLFSDPLGTLKEVSYITSRQAPAPIRSIYDLALGQEARYGTGYPVPGETDPNRTVPRIILRGLNLPAAWTAPEPEKK